MSERTPAEVFRPGEYVRDEMAARDWSVETLAEKSGIAAGILIELVERDYPCDERIATGLSRAFGTSAVLWTNLDRIWQGWPITNNANRAKGYRR